MSYWCVPVVIVQTHPVGFMACIDQLSRCNYVMGKDYLVTAMPELAARYIVPDQLQMLVVDDFRGDIIAAEEFVWRMKRRNFYLISANFSRFDTKAFPPFDIVIRKGKGSMLYSDLIAKTRDLLWVSVEA